MATAVDEMVGQHDAVLVDRHRAGDQRAFAVLYDANYTRLLSFIRRRVREGDLVEDIAQEAFVKAFAAMGDLRDTKRFYPWLIAITRRLILDHYKSRVRVIAVPDLDGGESEPADDALMQQQVHADLATALLRVRARHQQVLRLREHEDLSYQEIAVRLGIPETAVAPLLFRARKALQREYLAITREERTAVVVPALLFLVGAARRLRDRLAGMVPYLPEPAALTSSMAAVALGVSAVLGQGLHEERRYEPRGAQYEDASRSEDLLQPTAAGHRPLSRDASAFASRDGVAPDGQGLARLKHVKLDQDAARRGQDEARGRPYYFEFADNTISLDPEQMQRDIQSSLAGDHGWMEGRPCQDVSGHCY